MRRDLTHALKLIARAPGQIALIVATMALGIAAVVVLASVAYGVLMRPLPWADAPRLVRLFETREGSTMRFRPLMTNVTYRAWQEQPSQTLDAMGAWASSRRTSSDFGEPQRFDGADVTPGLFELLGVPPLIGRTFTPGDELPDAPRVIVLGYGFWRQQLGGRADVIGQMIRFDDRAYEIIGVMPQRFAFPERETQFWTPFYIRPVTSPGQRGTSISLFQAIGRLREGSSADQATAEGTARGRAAAVRGPVVMAVFGSTGEVRVSAVPMIDALTGDVRDPIRLMMVAVVLLLVTATANVASLQLARSVSRRREFAVRAALGASQAQLVRQTLVENLVIGVVSAAVGLALAAAAHAFLPLVLPRDFPRLDEIALDSRVQGMGLALGLFAALIFGLLPAFETRKRLVPVLSDDGIAPVGGTLRSPVARMRAAIMAAQVAVAFVLLVGAVLLIRSFVNLTASPIGYDASNLLIARVVLPSSTYPTERWAALMEQIAARVQQDRTVAKAAFTTTVPFATGVAVASFPVRNRDGQDLQVQTGSQIVSAGYFATLVQPVLEGREFTTADNASARPVALVNREFSRRYLDGRALGWTLPGAEGKPPLEIVGVVGDTARQSVTDTPQPEVYFAAAQRGLQGGATLVVRGQSDPNALVTLVRNSVRASAPAAAIDSIRTMEDLVSSTLARPRLYSVLLGTFAAFAVLVAAVGLFSVLTYNVAQRAREIAVRSALGAETSDIVGLVARQTAAIVGVGVAAGGLLALWAAALMQTLLFGVTSRDMVSFAVVAVILLAVAVLASIVPARRAAQVDPVRVLRAG